MGREQAFAIARIGLGTGQMFGATTTAMLLLQTGLSPETQVAFTITTALACASLLMKYLGCWDVKKPI